VVATNFKSIISKYDFAIISDMMLSTLRSYIEAMGGELNITVRFADQAPVSLVGIGQDNA
jgi:hypothetical protein